MVSEPLSWGLAHLSSDRLGEPRGGITPHAGPLWAEAAVGCFQALALNGLCSTFLRGLHILGLLSITYLPGPQFSHPKEILKIPQVVLLLTLSWRSGFRPLSAGGAGVQGLGLCQLGTDPP